jgi:hypothetical protein
VRGEIFGGRCVTRRECDRNNREHNKIFNALFQHDTLPQGSNALQLRDKTESDLCQAKKINDAGMFRVKVKMKYEVLKNAKSI